LGCGLAMSRKAIIVFLLVYLFIAFAGSILWELATPELADVQSEAVIGQTIGLIVGLFVLPGVLPLIYSAVRRFRAESAYETLGAWSGLGMTLLLLAAPGKIYDGTLQPAQIPSNAAAVIRAHNDEARGNNGFSSNNHDDFTRFAKKRSCVDAQRKNPVNWQMGVTNGQIDAYCTCYSSGGARVVTRDDLSYPKNGRASPSAQEKMEQLISGCVRTVFGK
jgi:hypothetical protein